MPSKVAASAVPGWMYVNRSHPPRAARKTGKRHSDSTRRGHHVRRRRSGLREFCVNRSIWSCPAAPRPQRSATTQYPNWWQHNETDVRRSQSSSAPSCSSTTGESRDNAAAVARALGLAEAWNLGSHGLLRLPIYLDRLEAGGYAPTRALTTVTDLGALMVLDGNTGLGHWQLEPGGAARRAARQAVRHHRHRHRQLWALRSLGRLRGRRRRSGDGVVGVFMRSRGAAAVGRH